MAWSGNFQGMYPKGDKKWRFLDGFAKSSDSYAQWFGRSKVVIPSFIPIFVFLPLLQAFL